MNFLVTRSAVFSILIHGLAVALLIFSLDFSTKTVQTLPPPGQIIEATAIDSKEVEQEVTKLKELEQKKDIQQKKQEKKLKELENKTHTAEQKRKEEELKLADLKQKQVEEEKKRKEEEQKLAETKKKQEALQKEEERKKKEVLAKQEADKKKKEAEASLKKQLAAETAAQDRQDLTVIQQYTQKIIASIQAEYNLLGLVEPGLSCVLFIRMSPTGDVIDTRISKSSGNTIFDSRAVAAVQKASPLPVPDDARVFAKMREINMTFKPN